MLSFFIVIGFFLISIIFVYLLLINDKGEKEPLGALWIAAGFGVLAVIVAIFLENQIFHSTQPLSPGFGLPHLFSESLIIGLIEESCKFLPLALFIYKKRYFNEHTDGIIYFAIAGLSFGLPENILYTISFGSSAGIGRLILTPLFHASLTGMVGYFLAKYKVEKKNVLRIIPYFLLAIFIHALYDFGLSSNNNYYVTLSIIITILLTIIIYFLYMRATDLDREMGLSQVGNTKYCRNCGKINKGHLLFCTNCGHHV